MEDRYPSFYAALMAGGCAGTAVDVALYPLDTIKTRLQSGLGFWASGGFRHIYSGLGPAAIGSAPGAAAFFCSYESSKKLLAHLPYQNKYCNFAIAASIGEISACLVRVPTEVIKQRRQVKMEKSSFLIIRSVLETEGLSGFFRGYVSTVSREIPFSFIQFPLWEFGKIIWAEKQHSPLTSWQSAICGSIAGAISAAVTTPLDVAKTRIILSSHNSAEASSKVLHVILKVFRQKGIQGIFSGVVPRTLIMTFGGAIYFGAYEKVLSLCS